MKNEFVVSAMAERLEERCLLSSTAQLVQDINTVPITAGSVPSNLIDINGTLYFTASTSTTGSELWKSDGTAAGTVFVAEIAIPGGSNPGNLTDVNGRLFFTATDDTHGRELWLFAPASCRPLRR